MASYDPTKVTVVVGGVPMRAFADGLMVEAEFSVDQSSMHIGTQGEGRHIDNKDKSGTITVRLADYSVSNETLQGFYEAGAPIPIILQDKTTKADLVFAEECKLRKVPNMGKSDETIINEWVFNAIRMNIVHSGDVDS